MKIKQNILIPKQVSLLKVKKKLNKSGNRNWSKNNDKNKIKS